MNIIIMNYESVWPDVDLKINVGHCDLYIWSIDFAFYLEDFNLWTSYFGIMGQYDQTFALKINVCHCDLYFMVHWFCLKSQTLFDEWVSYFHTMRQGDPIFDLKINIGQRDLYFMV